jgi:hypothetical protein
VRSLVAVLLALTAYAGEGGPLVGQEARLRNDLDTTVVTVGDQIQLTVTVEHPVGARVAWPDSLDLDPFEVLGAEALAPAREGGSVRSGVVLTLTAFELGELEIPSFEVWVEGPGEASQTLATDRFGVEVVSVGVDEGGDIRDIRGPLAVPLGVVTVSLWLVALGALVAVAFWLGRRMRRKKAGGPVTPVPTRPPHEVALEALTRIAASSMLERGQVKEYHIAISEALRTYVEGRFLVPALEMTTREVVDGLGSGDAPRGFIDGLRRFLDRCDLVKFAKVRPDMDTSRGTLALGRELVESTIPERAPSLPDAVSGGRPTEGVSQADPTGAGKGDAGGSDGGATDDGAPLQPVVSPGAEG